MKGVVKGGNNDSGGSKLNIFTQATEPTTKEGIWIKTAAANNYNNVSITNSIYRENMQAPYPRPVTNGYAGMNGVSGNYIYSIGTNRTSANSNVVSKYDVINNTWYYGTNLPSQRNNMGVVGINDKVYVIGGDTYSSGTDTVYKDLNIYNTSNDTWTIGASMSRNKLGFGCVAIGTKIYCISGGNTYASTSNYVDIYDTTTNTWSTGADIPTARRHFFCLAIGTKIYCIGGEQYVSTTVKSVNAVEIYDTINNTWTTGASMPTAREYVGGYVLNNKIYCFGGDTTTTQSTSEVYDITTNSWSAGPAIPPMLYFSYQYLNNKLYCFGLEKLYIYDIATSTWHQNVSLPTGRYYLNCVTKNDTIYCIGGGISSTGGSKTFEAYNTATNTWTTLVDMPNARVRFGCVLVETKIYCIGGAGSSALFDIYDTTTGIWSTGENSPQAFGYCESIAYNNKIYCFGFTGGTTAHTFVYDIASNTWSTAADCPIANQHSSGCVLVGSKVYLLGGNSATNAVTSYIYNITTNTWSQGSNLPNPRGGFSGVLVGTKIYCIGGSDTGTYSGDAVIPVDVYDTATNTWSTSIPHPVFNDLYGERSVYINGKIYSMGGYITNDKVWTIDITNSVKTPTDKSIVLVRYYEENGAYRTQLFDMKLSTLADANTRLLTSFDDVWIYENGQYLELPTYYGDGTQWIKFKN